jgi:GntR family transcriptional regulator
VVSFVPRYHEIELALRRRIGGLRPGDALPSDAMLCQEFHVSRMTARGAVQRLAQEGLVVRVPGKGTFVAQPPGFRQASNLLSFTTEMTRRGLEPSSRILRRGLRPAREVEIARLHLRPGAEVVEVRRLRLADERPIVLESTCLPASCADVVLEADLERGSLHQALVEARRVPTRGRATLGAEAAGDEEGELLGVEPGSPLLVERRLIEDQRGRPLELTESRYAADRYSLDVAFDVDDSTPRAAGPALDARGRQG